uniref:RING-type domain-containing protein n=1 Tax=Fagus sylvatica TaxID=28930 RepID=A0A2N9ISE7_FAGSY
MAIQAQLYPENHGFPLCGSQDWIMDNNGCGGGGGGGSGIGYGGFNYFCFNLQQKQQLQQQQRVQQLQNQQQRNQNLFFDNMASTLKNNPNINTINNNSHQSMLYPQSIASQFEKQNQEIDHYIRIQNERLRLVLQEQRKQHLASLVKKIEAKTSTLLRQKDEEIAQAVNRTMELEDFLRRLEAENQAWQRVAQENEAMVVSLNNTLEQVKERAPFGFYSNGAEDCESCCYVNREQEEEVLQEKTEENRGVEGCEIEEQRKMTMVCKGCNSRSSCMLFLPCRHLCSCKACEPLLDSCPVCTMEKKASIEALIF